LRTLVFSIWHQTTNVNSSVHKRIRSIQYSSQERRRQRRSHPDLLATPETQFLTRTLRCAREESMPDLVLSHTLCLAIVTNSGISAIYNSSLTIAQSTTGITKRHGDGFATLIEGSPRGMGGGTVYHRFKVLCFSANSTILRSTNIPFRSRTSSIYSLATFVRSAFSPRSSNSSAVVGTQNGSRSKSWYLSKLDEPTRGRKKTEHTR
jgi:ribosomal protein L32